jgi:uncharacterized protein (UPF0548 family)
MILSRFTVLSVLVCVCVVTAAPSKSVPVSLRRRSLYRKAQIERQKLSRRLHSCPANDNSSSHQGTCLRWSLPTVDRASKWFSAKSSAFNHESVGMTNPYLHFVINEDQEAVLQASARTSSGDEVEWWPQATVMDKSWRMIRYRRTLGVGTAIYDAVRDACLDWEFASKGKGIVQLKVTSEPRELQRREHRGGYEVVHTRILGDGDMMCTPDSCRQLGAGRRLVTYTEASLKLKWLPRLCVVNPVMVVYDLVDQRAAGTTFTSTAYATMKGHWLSGEERMTVAHRDGTGNVDLEILSYSRPAPSLVGRLVWPFIGPFQTKFFESQMEQLERVAKGASPAITRRAIQVFHPHDGVYEGNHWTMK